MSSPSTLSAFLLKHIESLSQVYDVDVVANFNGDFLKIPIQANQIDIPIQRKIMPYRDLLALASLIRILKTNSYSSIHSVTPKAGIISMLAARLTHVPLRIHWFTGQVWVNRRGLSRQILKGIDKLTALLATDLLVDSPSQMDFLIKQNVVSEAKARVLGAGSICGVDTQRFRPDPIVRSQVRATLNIENESLVLLYVGRVNSDKGVLNLAHAVKNLNTEHDLVLVIAGIDEENLVPKIGLILDGSRTKFVYVGHSNEPEKLMVAADIFCMPSFREGFGLSVIEAAACGVPAIASNIYGLTDAVDDHKTGILYDYSKIGSLELSLSQLIHDALTRLQYGNTARIRAIRDFEMSKLTNALKEFYLEHLS